MNKQCVDTFMQSRGFENSRPWRIIRGRYLKRVDQEVTYSIYVNYKTQVLTAYGTQGSLVYQLTDDQVVEHCMFTAEDLVFLRLSGYSWDQPLVYHPHDQYS